MTLVPPQHAPAGVTHWPERITLEGKQVDVHWYRHIDGHWFLGYIGEVPHARIHVEPTDAHQQLALADIEPGDGTYRPLSDCTTVISNLDDLCFNLFGDPAQNALFPSDLLPSIYDAFLFSLPKDAAPASATSIHPDRPHAGPGTL